MILKDLLAIEPTYDFLSMQLDSISFIRLDDKMLYHGQLVVNYPLSVQEIWHDHYKTNIPTRSGIFIAGYCIDKARVFNLFFLTNNDERWDN